MTATRRWPNAQRYSHKILHPHHTTASADLVLTVQRRSTNQKPGRIDFVVQQLNAVVENEQLGRRV